MSGEFKSYRELSRTDWGTSEGKKLNLDEIKLGALLRIADASEAMAKNHVRLQEDCDYWKGRKEDLERENSRLYRSNCALRGQITKLRKQNSRFSLNQNEMRRLASMSHAEFSQHMKDIARGVGQ